VSGSRAQASDGRSAPSAGLGSRDAGVGESRDAGVREPRTAREIERLGGRYGLDPQAGAQLACLVDSLVSDTHAPTAVREPSRVVDDHLADSLVAIELEEIRVAASIADIGSGAGLPGLPLAVARPEARVFLVESASRKCAYLEGLLARCSIANCEVIHARVETWTSGRNRLDVVTARAVAALPVVLEYAAPLLRVGGTLVAWRGRRDPDEDRAAADAAAALGMRAVAIHRVHPYQDAEHRHLHVWVKALETPARFPRRPGMAAKRPLGGR